MNILDEEQIKEIIKLSLEGLQTDGGHHKQYFLEKILKIASKGSYNRLKIIKEWEEGIAP